MMAMLIDADALLKKLERMWDCTDIFFEPKELLCDPLSDCKGCKWKEILDFVKKIVKSSKPVDAVPVVRCKDCVYSIYDPYCSTKLICDFYLARYCKDPNAYCSCGIKKKDGEQK